MNETAKNEITNAGEQEMDDQEILSLIAADTAQSEKEAKSDLTAVEKARIERNRQKALLLRQARLSNQQLHEDPKRAVNCNR